MGYQRFIGLLIVVLMGFLSSCQAYKFYVGGKDGWVLNSSENYNHWAERNRFQVNDTLYFKYRKGSESVLVVTKEDYYSCNSKNPIRSFKDGNSVFKFDQSGPFFFISGNTESCQKGQKLIVVVLALRHKQHHHSAAPSPSPAAHTPAAVSPPTEEAEPPAPSSGSPESGTYPSDNFAPVPAPAKNMASRGFGAVNWLVLGISVGLSVFLGSFVNMV